LQQVGKREEHAHQNSHDDGYDVGGEANWAEQRGFGAKSKGHMPEIFEDGCPVFSGHRNWRKGEISVRGGILGIPVRKKFEVKS
jgi:hypothetical protein